jgi:integrase
MPDKKTADAINYKIEAAVVDEDRIWQKLRKDLRLEQRPVCSVRDLVKKYMTEYVETYNIDTGHKRAQLAAFVDFMGDVSAEHIDVSSVGRFLGEKKKEGLENSTINLYGLTIKHMARWATDQGIFENYPLGKLPKLPVREYCPPKPDEKIIDAVFNEIDSRVLPVFCFLRETGCRKGEAANLRYEQIDYGKQVVTFYTSRKHGTRTKSGKSRQVPLTKAAIAALFSVPKHDGQTVFSNPEPSREALYSRLFDFWKQARDKAAEANPEYASLYRSLRIHDLRHAYAITLAENGCEMHFISEVLGHYSIEFTRRRYARFSPESASQRVLRILENKKRAQTRQWQNDD